MSHKLSSLYLHGVGYAVAIGDVVSQVHEDFWVEILNDLACKMGVVGRAGFEALEKFLVPFQHNATVMSRLKTNK